MNQEELSKLKLSDLLKKNYVNELFEESKGQKAKVFVDTTKEVKPSDTIPPEPRPDKPRNEIDREGDPCDDVADCEFLEDLMEECNRGGGGGSLGGYIKEKMCEREECDEPMLECVDIDARFNPQACMVGYNCSTGQTNKGQLCKAIRDNFCETGELNLPGCKCVKPPRGPGAAGQGCFNCMLYWDGNDFDDDGGTHPKTPVEICRLLYGRGGGENGGFLDECTRSFFQAQGCTFDQYTCETCAMHLGAPPKESDCDCGSEAPPPETLLQNNPLIPRGNRGVDCDEYRQYAEEHNQYVDEYKEWCEAYNQCKQECYENQVGEGNPCPFGNPDDDDEIPPHWFVPCGDDVQKLPLPGDGDVGPIEEPCASCPCTQCYSILQNNWEPNKCYNFDDIGRTPEERKEKTRYRCTERREFPPDRDTKACCGHPTQPYSDALECYCQTNNIPYRKNDGTTGNACDEVGSWCISGIWDCDADCCKAREAMYKKLRGSISRDWDCEAAGGPPPAGPPTSAELCNQLKGVPPEQA